MNQLGCFIILSNTGKEIDCILVPTSTEEEEALNNEKFKNFIQNLGFKKRKTTTSKDENFNNITVDISEEQKYWQLDKNCTSGDIEIIIEKLDNFEKVLNENIVFSHEDS